MSSLFLKKIREKGGVTNRLALKDVDEIGAGGEKDRIFCGWLFF